jgi:hypothetical protein
MLCGQISAKTQGNLFVLATNGMNPFGDFNLKHST